MQPTVGKRRRIGSHIVEAGFLPADIVEREARAFHDEIDVVEVVDDARRARSATDAADSVRVRSRSAEIDRLAGASRPETTAIFPPHRGPETMMAVDSKHGTDEQTLLGKVADPGGERHGAGVASSLMVAAQALPNVESSLEEFIARANQTSVDAEQWTRRRRARREGRRREAQGAGRGALEERRGADARARGARELAAPPARRSAGHARRGRGACRGRRLVDRRDRATPRRSRSPISARARRGEDRVDEAQQRRRSSSSTSSRPRASTPCRWCCRRQRPAVGERRGDGEERIRSRRGEGRQGDRRGARAAQAGLTVIDPARSRRDRERARRRNRSSGRSRRRGCWIAVAFVGGIALMFGASKLMIALAAARPIPRPPRRLRRRDR